jgi:archaellin
VVSLSVFAYTVLTEGGFSSQKSNESFNVAIDEVRSGLTLRCRTQSPSGALLTIRVAVNRVPLDVKPPYQMNAVNGSLESSGLTNSMAVSYLAKTQESPDPVWAISFTGANTGANDGDVALETTERAVISVGLGDYSYDSSAGLSYHMDGGTSDPFIDKASQLLGNFGQFSLTISPVQGAPLIINKGVRQSLHENMSLR